MVEMYGPESIGSLMPLVVNVLENLDSALADNQVSVCMCVCWGEGGGDVGSAY